MERAVGYFGYCGRRIEMGPEMAHVPPVADGVLQGVAAGEAAGVEVGSPGWYAWLATDAARSFSYRSPHGAYTARKERRQRGGVYWVAYRTAGGRQHKAYLGRAQDLTPQRLDEVAAALAERVAGAAADLGDVAPSTSVAGGVSPGADGSILLATKLFVPRPRPDLVQRPRLLARLDAGLDTGRCSLLVPRRGRLVTLWNRLFNDFPSGEIVFNSYTRLAIWIAQHARGSTSVADR